MPAAVVSTLRITIHPAPAGEDTMNVDGMEAVQIQPAAEDTMDVDDISAVENKP